MQYAKKYYFQIYFDGIYIKLRLYILCLISLILIIPQAYAQKYLIHTYTEEDGLPSSYINSMSQDSSGMIWIATRSGLCTYDSHRWKEYYSNNGRPFRDALKVKVDEQGQVWVLQNFSNLESNTDGITLSKLDNRWKNFSIKLPKGYTISDHHSNFALSTYNDVTIAGLAVYGLGVFVFHNSQWQFFDARDKQFPSTKIYSVYIDKGNLYFTTDKGIYIHNHNSTYSFKKAYTNIVELQNKDIFAMNVERIQNFEKIWFYTNKFIGYIQNNKFVKVVDNLNYNFDSRFLPFTLIPNYFNSIIYGNMLEIKIFNPITKTTEKFDKSNGLIDNGASEMMIDRENILWVSSSRGISKVSSLRFKNYYQAHGMLEDEVVSVIEQTKGNFVIGHNFGLSFFNGNTFTTAKFNKDLYYERVSGMVKDRNNNIWFASYRNGLGVVDINHKIKWYSSKQLKVESVMAVALDSSQRILFTDNINLYELKNGISKKIYINWQNSQVYIRGIFVLKDGRIALTTSRFGVLIVDKNGNISFINSKNNFSASNAFTIFENQDGSLLIGTDDGLYKYEKGKYSKAYLNYNKIDKRVFFIIQDYNKELWIGTDAGIARFYQGQIWYYGVKEGISGLETNRSAAIIASNGQFLIGTNRGLSIYRKEYDSKRDILPITQLLNYEVRGQNYAFNESREFDYEDNSIIFNFNVVSFYDEKKNSILYKLEGLEGGNAWVEINNLNDYYVSFPNLKNGKYVFRLKAKNALGIWGNEITSGVITINKPYYFRFYFIVLVIGILIVVSAAYIKLSTNKKYRYRLEKEVTERTFQLEASERRYKQMFQDNNAIMIIINPENGKIEDANPSALKFYSVSKEELLGKSIVDYVVKLSEEEKHKILKNIVSEKEFEIPQFINSMNEIRYLKIHLSKIDDVLNKSVYCIIDDITDQKEAEKQLVKFNEDLELRVQIRTLDLEEALKTLNDEIEYRSQAEQELITAKEELELSLNREKELSMLKSRFISMVSHEYRTPLTVIFSSAELIKEFAKISKPDSCIEYSKRIQDSVKTLTGLLEGVMAVGEDTVINVFKEKFSVNEYFHYVADTFSDSIKKSHKIRINELEENLSIYQDKNLIWQVLNQVLSNAAKFSDKNTEIIIDYKIDDNMFYISIKDEGKGISAEELEVIFEPFYRSAETIGIIPGTGLGLTIAKKNIEALKGRIYAESIIGLGTTFYIEIPIN